MKIKYFIPSPVVSKSKNMRGVPAGTAIDGIGGMVSTSISSSMPIADW